MSASSITHLLLGAANSTWQDADWVRAQLRPHAGKTLQVVVWPLAAAGFTLAISAEGEWVDASADAAAPASAILRISPALLPRLATVLASTPEKPGAAIDLTGDPALVRTLRDLLDVLPLALEDRLAALAGPIVAHGVSTTLRALSSWPGHAAERVGAGLAVWLTEESATLLKRSTFESFRAELAALEARAEGLAATLPPG